MEQVVRREGGGVGERLGREEREETVARTSNKERKERRRKEIPTDIFILHNI